MTVRELPPLRLGPVSRVWRPWVAVVIGTLAVLIVLLMAAGIAIGDYPLSVPRVFSIVLAGTDAPMERLVVWKWRMPRVVTALVVGMALGIAGALTQSVARNALASPDILGVTSGASAFAVAAIVLGKSDTVFAWLAGVGLSLAALFGGLFAGAIMWLLAWRRTTDPLRLVLFGIILSALFQACLYFLISRADISDAGQATFWLHGSLNSPNWDRLRPAALVLVVSVLLLGWLGFLILAHSLGPTLAQALGQGMGRAQWSMLGVAIVLSAMSVSVAGPIQFIAFVGPQIALRLLRSSTPPLFTSALVGAALLLAADIVVQLLPHELPVGVVTSATGGVFLVYLLVRQNRMLASTWK